MSWCQHLRLTLTFSGMSNRVPLAGEMGAEGDDEWAGEGMPPQELLPGEG